MGMAMPSACQKSGKNVSKVRGSSRGRQPASNGIECPEMAAVQLFRPAKRGLLRRLTAAKVTAFLGFGKARKWFFDSLGLPPRRAPGRRAVPGRQGAQSSDCQAVSRAISIISWKESCRSRAERASPVKMWSEMVRMDSARLPRRWAVQ